MSPRDRTGEASSTGGSPSGALVTLEAEDDRSLAERMAADHAAFAELYRRHLPAIHAFAYRRTGSRALAEDVAATTFERALRSAAGFRWTRGGVLAWLYRIAGNALIDQQRGRAVAEGTRARIAAARMAPTPEPEPGEGLAPDELDELRRALDQLRPRYQEVIALRHLADLTPAETAAVLGITTANVAVTLHRAMGALRREMERGGS